MFFPVAVGSMSLQTASWDNWLNSRLCIDMCAISKQPEPRKQLHIFVVVSRSEELYLWYRKIIRQGNTRCLGLCILTSVKDFSLRQRLHCTQGEMVLHGPYLAATVVTLFSGLSLWFEKLQWGYFDKNLLTSHYCCHSSLLRTKQRSRSHWHRQLGEAFDNR